MTDQGISRLQTPCLLLEIEKLDTNIARMRERLDHAGWSFRPHVKTCKSIDVARRCFTPHEFGPITVSTLREAEYFADAGFTDILYAVSIVPDKLPRVLNQQRRGVRIQCVLDDAAVAERVGKIAEESQTCVPVWIEIDCDGHRAGIPPERSTDIVFCAQQIDSNAGLELAGIMTHAGESYVCADLESLRRVAQQEQDCMTAIASTIEQAGIRCVGRSIGSSPTAFNATENRGITELRAGVFLFQDLFQSNLGVCQLSDIALSVVTTVVSHRRDKNWLICDAGGLALSKDRGTADQAVDYGFGQVCDGEGQPLDGHLVVSANQEHGIISRRGGTIDFDRFPIGCRLRILPNHACMTAAAHEGYHVCIDDNWQFWKRVNGW